MSLISSIQKDSITVLNTYRNKSGSTMVHLLESKVPGLATKKKIICCDGAGNPLKIKDFTKNGVDVYEKGVDGTTVLKTAEGKVQQIQKKFLDICEQLFRS